jgi:hypothetical protein
MSNLPPRTSPRETTSSDGRRYPEHLRVYHKYDELLMPIVSELQPASFDQLSAAIEDREIRAVLPSWLSSARWRGLVEIDSSSLGTRRYVVSPERAVNAA